MNLLSEKCFATFTGELEDAEHGSLLHVTQTRCATHAVTFDQTVKDHGYLLHWKTYIFAEWLVLMFSETLAALLTLEALNFVLSVETGFYHFDPAVVTS